MRGERNFELRGGRGSRDQCSSFQSIDHVWVSVIPWSMARCAPQFLGVSSQNTGVHCCFLLQGICPTQGSNLIVLHCRQTVLFEPPGKPSLKNQNSAKMKLENFRNFCEMNLKFCCLSLFCPQRWWQCNNLKFPFSLCDFSFLFIYFYLFIFIYFY